MTENEKKLCKVMIENDLDTLVISDWKLKHQGTPITHVVLCEDIHGNKNVQFSSGDPWLKYAEFFEGESVDYLYEKVLKLW